MIHVTLPQLCAHLDGELAEASAELVRRHLSECLECTERFGRMEELDETLLRILSDEPEEEFFTQLSASIPLGQAERSARPRPSKREARPDPKPIRKVMPEMAPEVKVEAKSEPKPEVKSEVKGVRPPMPAPARAPASTRRDRRNEPRLRRRAEDNAPIISVRAAVIAAVICCVVAGSIAWVKLRPKANSPSIPTPETRDQDPANATTESDSAPTPEELLERSANPTTEEARAEDSPTVEPTTTDASVAETLPETPKSKAPAPVAEKLVERAPKNFVPVRKIITETTMESSAGIERQAPAMPSAKPSRVAAAADAGVAAVRGARSASLEAAKSKRPTAFDKSADAWEAALPLLQGSPEALASARREWAQARFQAWAAEPTKARRDAAIASSRQYLLYAPPGPERDQAWTWLGRLKH